MGKPLDILAFDTAGPYCAAALLRGDSVTTRVDEMAKGQAEHLMSLLEEVLAADGLGFRDLDGIGVGVGPGNFTGIRISVSAARGLALGLGKPAVGVSLFETTQMLSGSVKTAVPAPRDQAYVLEVGGMDTPAIVMAEAVQGMALSSAFSPADHVGAMARLAAARVATGEDIPAPAPLYVRPADAAPSRDTPPVILD